MDLLSIVETPLFVMALGGIGWLIRSGYHTMKYISDNASQAKTYAETANHNSTKAIRQLTMLKDALLGAGSIKVEDVRNWDSEN